MSEQISEADLQAATEAIADIHRHVVLAPDVDAYLDKNAQYVARVAIEAYVYAQAELDSEGEVTSEEASAACYRFERLRQMGENAYEEEDMKTVLEQFLADREAALKVTES